MKQLQTFRGAVKKVHSWTKSFRTPVSCPNQVLSLNENSERVEDNELTVVADEEQTAGTKGVGWDWGSDDAREDESRKEDLNKSVGVKDAIGETEVMNIDNKSVSTGSQSHADEVDVINVRIKKKSKEG